jgi:hypothetical protein
MVFCAPPTIQNGSERRKSPRSLRHHAEKWVSLFLLPETLAIEALPPIVPEQEVTTENEPDTLAA